jgi:flagella basal body P-ring formation protein FlgA
MLKAKFTIILMLAALMLAPSLRASAEDGYQVISGDLILEVARSYMLSHAPWADYDVDVGFNREMADVPAYLNGKVELEVEQSGDPGLADVNLLKVRIDINGQPYAKINVGPYLSVDMPIVVADGDIQRGRIITDDDITIKTVDLTRKHINEPVTEIEDATGLEAKQSIKDGTPVLPRYLAEPLLVERGKDVTAIVRVSGMEITLTAQALDNGRMGETVRVKNKDSGRIITGEVIGHRLVEVRI